MKLSGIVTAAVAACTVLVFATIPAYMAKPKAPVLNLDGYLAPAGPIQTFKSEPRTRQGTPETQPENPADPYFGLYALELARRGGLDISKPAAHMIDWMLKAQRPDGRFERFCETAGGWTNCGRSDSDDATLSRWLQVLHWSAKGSQLSPEWQKSSDAAEQALMALKLKSGIYSVFPHDTPGYLGYALFKDNVEVLESFESLVQWGVERGRADVAQRYSERARALRLAMHKEFGKKPFELKRLAVGAEYKSWRFYPHGVAIPFGWAENYFEDPTPQDWQQWLDATQEAWNVNAATDYPWGLIAVAALQTGRPDVAGCWLKKYRNNPRIRWNVLEETSAQIIEAAAPSCTQS